MDVVPSINMCFIDADPIAYKGACSVDKLNYQWVRKELDNVVEESKVFPSAEECKTWYQEQVEMLEKDMTGWERLTIQVLGSLEDALKNTEACMKDYLDTFELVKHTKSKGVVKAWLTASGAEKLKDIKGLEDRYQFNRFESESVKDSTWIPKKKPEYLDACRAHLIKVYDFVKISPKGYEADSLVLHHAMKAGKRGVILSIDKDLGQAQDTYFINMNPIQKDRECLYCDPIGSIIIKDNGKKKDYKGVGFKWLMFQTICGDPTDGYKGLKGAGPVVALSILEPCTSKAEMIEAMEVLYKDVIRKLYLKAIKIYADKTDNLTDNFSDIDTSFLPTKLEEYIFTNGTDATYIYEDWEGNIQTRTVRELMSQHCQLSYQETKDKPLNPIKRYFEWEDNKSKGIV